MLRGITCSRLTEGAYQRHWYQDDLFDLYVWLDDAGAIAHFQLAYDKPTFEKALDWKREDGFMHYRVNQYAADNRGSMTPLLILDPEFPKQRVIREFGARSTSIDIGVANFVAQMLRIAPNYYYQNNRIKWAAAGVAAGAIFLLWRLLR